MFDFDAGKLLVIGVVALIVIGPKDLPRVLRQLGQTVAQLRRMASEFQSQFMDAMREAELDDIRQDVQQLGEQTKIQSTFNPIETVRRQITDAVADRRAEPPSGAPSLGLEGLESATENGTLDFAAASAAPVAEAASETADGQKPAPKHPVEAFATSAERGATGERAERDVESSDSSNFSGT